METRSMNRSGGVIERFREFLPSCNAVISLGEGNTPLVFSPKLSARVGRGCEVFIKNEGLNPTGSFKDRGMTVAVSRAVDRGARALICASTGNTSASAAAYAARAGIPCAVVLPAGKIATGKLIQAFAHGAKIVAIEGNFDDALRIVRELGDEKEFAIVNSINPDRIAGQKTAAFEIVDELSDAPDFHLLPVGNAGNITAYWAGYREFNARGRSTTLPAMIGFQASGAAPIFHNKVIENPETIASAIRIGNPASWKQARAALDESKGDVDVVTDEEILTAQSWVAQNEGIFVEPASAAPIAGLFNWAQKFPERSRIVCTVTGHGLKDPDFIQNRIGELDVLRATGENAASALTVMAVNALGARAISLTGAEAGILTDRIHTKARIANISPKQIQELLADDYIVIVAGFQGQSAEGETTTLGRGGSDLTAIALAGALNADACQIFTDVDGVFTCDPRVVMEAKKLDEIAYDELLEMAGAGSKVMQSRAVEFAKKFAIEFEVRSSLKREKGTIAKEETANMEDVVVRGVSIDRKQAKISIDDVRDEPGIAGQIFSTIARANIVVDMIVQSVLKKGTTDLSFTIHESDLEAATKLLKPIVKQVKASGLITSSGVAKLSVVGIGMRSHSGVAARLFDCLGKAGINIQLISTSEIKIAVVIDEADVERAAQLTHAEFGLAAFAPTSSSTHPLG